jgi:hypothetical protein
VVREKKALPQKVSNNGNGVKRWPAGRFNKLGTATARPVKLKKGVSLSKRYQVGLWRVCPVATRLIGTAVARL